MIPYAYYTHLDTTVALIGFALFLGLIISMAWTWGKMREKE